jgi:MFS family permease
VNLLVGAVLVTAMVDVPLFVNAIEVDLERSAVVAGWVLAAMTGFMVLATYGGGRCAQRYGFRLPALLGTAFASTGFLAVGLTWGPSTSHWTQAVHLALLDVGIGLTVAPTSSAVVDGTEAIGETFLAAAVISAAATPTPGPR